MVLGPPEAVAAQPPLGDPLHGQHLLDLLLHRAGSVGDLLMVPHGLQPLVLADQQRHLNTAKVNTDHQFAFSSVMC